VRRSQPSLGTSAPSDRAPRGAADGTTVPRSRTARRHGAVFTPTATQPHATVTRGVASVAPIPLFPQQLARAANGAREHPFAAARFLEEVMEDGAQVSDLRLQVA
jgi:hypothetical protein